MDAPADDSAMPAEPAVLTKLGEAVRVALSDQPPEERFLLAAYYVDGRTLAEIGGLLKVHEATVSRRLKRATDAVRKKLLRNLEKSGMSRRAAEEALGTDPRDVDLKIDLKKLLQCSEPEPFSKQDAAETVGALLAGAKDTNIAGKPLSDKATSAE